MITKLLPRLPLSWALLWLIVLVAVGCPKQQAPMPGPDPAEGAAPIDTLLQLLQRDRSSLSLPDAEQAGYQLPLRSALIDGALAQPLSFPPWADQRAKMLDDAQSPAALLSALRSLSAAGSQATAVEQLAPTRLNGTAPPRLRTHSPAPLPRAVFASQQGKLQTAKLPLAFTRELIQLAGGLEDIELHAEQWYQLEGLIRRPDRAAEEFFLDRDSGEYRFFTHPVGVQLEFLSNAIFINHGAILDDAARLLLELERRIPALAEAAKELPPSEGLLLHLNSRFGPIIVGGTGSDLHKEDAFLLIDPGGDDEWHNNAGATGSLSSSLSLAIDLGGNDSYRNERGHAQGAGFLGIGALVDWGEGSDRYAAGAQSQGAGFMGCGILWDRGGNDSYRSTGFAQGAGAFGLGLLIDESGNDVAAASGRAQGFASTAGLGAYLDLAGNDQRNLGVPGAPPFGIASGGGQGAGWGTRPFPWNLDLSLHGGTGLLYDRQGDDRNFAWSMGQGSSWFLSLGLHLDRQGNDQYICGRSCQGAAEHLAGAILLDGGGQDRYESSQLAQGAADDRSLGVLWDQGQANDQYRVALHSREAAAEIGRGMGYARQPRALGLLVDDGGDDRYDSTREGLGHAQATRDPGMSPTAMFIDLGGNDSYLEGQARPGAIPRNDSTWMANENAAGLDTFLSSPGWSPNTLEPALGFPPIAWQEALLSPDPETPEPGNRAVPASTLPAPPLSEASFTGLSVRQQWKALQDRFYQHVIAPEQGLNPEELNFVRKIGEEANVIQLRRASARLLIAHGETAGLRILIATLEHPSQDNPGGRRGTGALGSWLTLVTGTGEDFDAARWRSWFTQQGKDHPLAERWPAIARLEAAQLAAQRADPRALAGLCIEARELLPGDPSINNRASSLVGRWAQVLGHPESHGLQDPELAIELAELWLSWQPSRAAPLIALAQAWFTLGNFEMAGRALDSVAILDPDNARLLTLRRAMEP